MRSNPRRLFSFHVSSNAWHYQNTVTYNNDPRTWCYERKVCFLLKSQTSARTTPCTRTFITLRDDRHVWTDRNSLTGIDRHWAKRMFSKVFLYNLHLKCINSLRYSVIQSEEIIFTLRMWQRWSLSEHSDSKYWCIDSKSWSHERQVGFLLKREPSTRTGPRTWAFINLGDDPHAWTDWNSLTGIDRPQRVQK